MDVDLSLFQWLMRLLWTLALTFIPPELMTSCLVRDGLAWRKALGFWLGQESACGLSLAVPFPFSPCGNPEASKASTSGILILCESECIVEIESMANHTYFAYNFSLSRARERSQSLSTIAIAHESTCSAGCGKSDAKNRFEESRPNAISCVMSLT